MSIKSQLAELVYTVTLNIFNPPMKFPDSAGLEWVWGMKFSPHGYGSHGNRRPESRVTGQFADKPACGQSTR